MTVIVIGHNRRPIIKYLQNLSYIYKYNTNSKHSTEIPAPQFSYVSPKMIQTFLLSPSKSSKLSQSATRVPSEHDAVDWRPPQTYNNLQRS